MRTVTDASMLFTVSSDNNQCTTSNNYLPHRRWWKVMFTPMSVVI